MLPRIQTDHGKISFLENEPVQDRRRTAELELVRRVQSGDQAAFCVIVDRYQTKVFSIIYRILRNREDTEDAAQQVFTSVYFAIGDFDCRCSLLTWIYKIAINECYSHLRRRRVRRAYEADALEFSATGSHSGFEPEPGADNTTAARDYLNKLLSRVSENDRLLLILKEVEGHSIAELAEMTGIRANVIKTRLFRARRKLVEAAGRLSHTPLNGIDCLHGSL